MKTCKKILAGVLVFAMMLSMCAFVSADEVTETETTVTDKLLFTNNFDGLTAGTVLNSGKTFNSDGGASEKVFYAKGGSPSNKLNTTTVVEEGTNKYITTTHNRLGYNPYLSASSFETLGYGDELSVFSTSYDIMIPANDKYKENRRYAVVNAGTYDTGEYGKVLCSPVASIYNGKIAGSASGSEALYSKPIDYKYGDWVTIRIDAWVNSDKGISSAVYADGKLIYAGKYNGTLTAVGMGCRFIEFLYANVEGGTKVSSEAATSGIESYTNYDNIKVSLLTADNEVTAEEIAAQIAADEAEEQAKAEAEAAAKAATPEASILEFSGANLDSTAGTKAKAVFTSTGDLTTSIVQGGDTDDHSAEAYEVIEDENGNYTNLTSTSYKLLVGNVRDSFDDWVQKGVGDKSTFVYSTDMKVSNFNANVVGRMSLGLDMMSGNVKDADGNVIKENKAGNAAITYTVGTDGKIEFVNSVTTNHTSVPSAPVAGAKRSETRDVTAGEWFNVKFVFEITHGATQYEIKVYGIFEDDVIFEDEFTITYTDYDKDGVSDDIHVGQFDYLIGVNDKTHNETVTSFKSMSFVKNNNFNWNEINTDAWLNRVVEISKDASGNVDVYAKKSEGAFTNETLVIAICNANGTVKEVITSNAVAENGTMSYEVPASKVTAGNIVKGFVFDSLTSAKPQMPKGTYIVK